MTDALTLREAAERYRFKLATLRHEAREGRLAVYRIGKAYYTTPADIQAMVEKCRVPRSRTSTSIAPGTASASGMVLDQSALDAVLRTRLAPKSNSQNTSPANIARRQRQVLGDRRNDARTSGDDPRGSRTDFLVGRTRTGRVKSKLVI